MKRTATVLILLNNTEHNLPIKNGRATSSDQKYLHLSMDARMSLLGFSTMSGLVR